MHRVKDLGSEHGAKHQKKATADSRHVTNHM